MHNVHVTYGFSDRSRAYLLFAAGLAHRLSAMLFVWTHRDRPATALLKEKTGDDVEMREHVHVQERVRMAIGDIAPGLAPRFNRGDPLEGVREDGAIVIADAASRPNGAAALLSPMGERALEARGPGEICLPFGNGASALDASRQAIGLAAALKMRLLFYHTTWKADGLPETAQPEAHMIAGAREMRQRLEREAALRGVPFRTVVETAASIVEGVCRAALNERCALIAMSRGRGVGHGSYVDGVLARTPIPVFTAGRKA